MLWLLFSTSLFACLQIGDFRCECTEKVILLLDDDDTFRLVKSPDYPRSYCPGMNCTWRVVSPNNGSRIYFYAEKIDLREGKDFIEFYDQKYLSIPENATYRCTGSGIPCAYSTDSKIMTIRFLSWGGGDVENMGFQGVVSGYDKKFRELRNTLCRYLGIPVFLLIIGSIIFILWCCYRKRRNPKAEYTQAPTSEKSNPEKLMQ